jgi:hypothetical protein
MLVLLGFPSVFANGETFGPAEWPQYRMNSENNPVFHSKTPKEINRIIDTDIGFALPLLLFETMFILEIMNQVASILIISKQMNLIGKAKHLIGFILRLSM